MFQTFLISMRLTISYHTNGIIFFLKKIPGLKQLLRGKCYDAPILKNIALVFATIWEILKRLGTNILYLSFIYAIIIPLSLLGELPKDHYAIIWIQSMFLLSLIGGRLNNHLFLSGESDYYAICLLRMDAKKYAISQYAYYLIGHTLSFFLGYFIVGYFVVGISALDCILLSLFPAACKLTSSALDLSQKELHWNSNIAFNFIFAGVLFVSCIVLPQTPFSLPLVVIRSIILVICLTGIIGIIKLHNYKDYDVTYKTLLNESRKAVSDAKNNNETLSKRKIISTDATIASNKTGLSFMHDLFVKRHYKLLWKPSLNSCFVALLCFGIISVIFLAFPDIKKEFSNAPTNILPFTFFLMYFCNRGLGYTQALFVNCDVGLLPYSFYRKKENLLKLFLYRLIDIIKINLLPAIVICAGLCSVFFITDPNTALMDYAVVCVTIISLSIFFSVHYMVLYYLLQPYTIDTEIKSPAYTIIKWGTYYLCFALLQIKVASIAIGIGTIIFCILYCLLSCILVYFLAPKTFKIKK